MSDLSRWVLVGMVVGALTACGTSDGDGEPADTGGTVGDTIPEDDGATPGDDSAGAGDADAAQVDDGQEGGPDTSDGESADAGDTGDPDDTGEGEPGCAPTTPEDFAACVDVGNYSDELEFVAKVRPAGTENALLVRSRLVSRLEEYGFQVELDSSPGLGVNVIGTRLGTSAPDEVVIISGHYDSVPLCAGADDNGTAVAGALEAARVLAKADHDRTLIVAFWDEEERGLIGSWAWMRGAVDAGHKFVVHFVFEMLGYRDDAPGSQSLPNGFDLAFPAAAKAVADNDGRGDFIALITDTKSLPYAEAITSYSESIGHKALEVAVSDFLIQSNLIGDLKRSDHAASWGYGIPAMMITDTANFRYPGYHCTEGEDSIERLDADFAIGTVAATVYAAAMALSADAPTAAVTPTDTVKCDTVTNSGCDAGQKCAMAWEPGGWYSVKCIPLLPNPAALKETCVRPNGTIGEDTCDVGLFCAFWGLPFSSPPQRWCLHACRTDQDCEAGDVCISFGTSIPTYGACIPSCDPFDADSCGPNLNCTNERDSTDGRRQQWTCNRIRTSAEGEECVRDLDECQAGLSCGYSMVDGVPRCGLPCDDAHPCPGNKTCQVAPNPSEAWPGSGICH